MARVRPDGGADELIAPEKEIIALSVGIASSPHTHILHQSKVADLGEEHGREGREEHGRVGREERVGSRGRSKGGGEGEMKGRVEGRQRGEREQKMLTWCVVVRLSHCCKTSQQFAIML